MPLITARSEEREHWRVEHKTYGDASDSSSLSLLPDTISPLDVSQPLIDATFDLG